MPRILKTTVSHRIPIGQFIQQRTIPGTPGWRIDDWILSIFVGFPRPPPICNDRNPWKSESMSKPRFIMYRVRNGVVRVRENLFTSFFRSAWTGDGERKNNSKFTDPNYPILDSDSCTNESLRWHITKIYHGRAELIFTHPEEPPPTTLGCVRNSVRRSPSPLLRIM